MSKSIALTPSTGLYTPNARQCTMAHFSGVAEFPRDTPANVPAIDAESDHKDMAHTEVVRAHDYLGEPALQEGPTVSRWEEWAYYLYYNGDKCVQ